MLFLAHDDSPAARAARAKSESPELWPARALLTPTWVGALALLVANDHWLKGSGLLPGVLTGKLSDFAGMLVAPTLLATLLGVRSRGALLACHVAVAAVFTGIQLSTGFAAQWSALMGMFGHPWTITCDPTDLLALPFLLLSWKLLVPQMDPELPALVPLQRTAVGALSVFGLWSTVATSDNSQQWNPGDEWYEDVFGNLVINNANDFDVALHIRPLRDDMMIDCQQVATDPGRLLDEDAFGEAVHWVLPARTNVAVTLPPETESECGAVWVAGEGIAPTIVFIDELATFPMQWFPGQSFSPSELGTAGLAIEFDAAGQSTWLGNTQLRFTPRTETLEQPESCEESSMELRFDWPLVVPNHEVLVLGVKPGVDGCFELELQDMIATSTPSGEPTQPQPVGEPHEFYLCAPAAAVPFAADEFLRFTEYAGTSGERILSVSLLDELTLEPQMNDAGVLVRNVRYLRGFTNDWDDLSAAIGRTLVAVDQVGCPWQIESDGCATVERKLELAVSGGQSFLQPGKASSFGDEASGMVHTAVLGYARQLAVIDFACAEGSLQLRHDIDMAIIDEPL
jgi:hypothetical protein